MFLISAAQLADIAASPDLESIPDNSLPQAIILMGYLAGRVSIYSAKMACGIDGSELGRSHTAHEAALSDLLSGRFFPLTLPSLSGPLNLAPHTNPMARLSVPLLKSAKVDLSSKIRATIAGHCTPFSLSIVTRTQFRRKYLLARLLTSITRARIVDIPIEVVLATDVEPKVAELALAALQAEFPQLVLRVAYGDPASGPSRISNLIAGINAALNRYVALIDDDDYIAAYSMEALTNITFLNDEPLVLMASNVMEEVWKETPLGHHVLAESRQTNTYWADKWRKMFHGVNQLPICALVAPRDWVQRRTSEFEFRFDLSEDYTLHLLLLSAPDLPRIHELGSVLCHISIRNDQSNTVTMTDRRPWVRDIANFLNDLLLQEGPVGNGTLQLLAGAQGEQNQPGAVAEFAQLRRENETMRGQLVGLRHQVRVLRKIVADRDELDD